MFIAPLLTIGAADVEAAYVPTDGPMDKEVCIHSGILLGHKRESNLTCDNMDGPKDIMLSVVSQTPYDFTGGI